MTRPSSRPSSRPSPRLSLVLRRVRRGVLARRRPLAAVCAALAVLAVLRAGAAPPEPRTMVVTAARDLPGGVVVAAGDLTRSAYAPDSEPDGAVPREADAVGRTTAGPMRRGEPVTDARLVAPSLLAGYPGLVAVPVRVGDAEAVRLLRVGDRVDLLASDPEGAATARTVARDVPVLSLPRSPADAAPGSSAGALVVVGLPGLQARTVAQASVTSFVSVVLTR